MADPRARPGWWWQGLALAVIGGIVLLLWLHPRVAANALASWDAGWHLACGRLIAAEGAVPRVDPLCFTSGGTDWVNLNWLAQLLLYRLHAWLGPAGPLALATLASGAALTFTALNLRARRVAPCLGLLALATVGLLLVGAHSIRPRTLSYALLALCAWLTAPGPGRPDPVTPLRAAALAVALLTWDHLHGGFVYGFALLGLGAAADGRQAQAQDAPVPRGVWLRIGVVALGLAGFVLHPHGFGALAHAGTYPVQLGAEVLGTTPELRPLRWPSAGSGLWVALVVLGLVGARAASRSARAGGEQRARASWGDALVVVVFALLALATTRALVPFVLLAAPWVAGRWSRLRADGPALRAVERRLRVAWRATPAFLAGACAAWLLLGVPRRAAPSGGTFHPEAWDAARLPVDAVVFLQGTEGRVLDAFEAGGLCVWALAPGRTAIDGRGDLHAASGAFRAYLDVMTGAPGWEERLAEWDVAWALLPVDAPLARALAERGWASAQRGPRWLVLRRP